MFSSSTLVSVLSLSLSLAFRLTLASPVTDPLVKRQAISCAVKGYDKGTVAYGYSSGSSVSSLSACGTKCKNDSQCTMFAFGSSSCLLYKSTVSANVSPVSNSPYIFYDKACVASTSSSFAPHLTTLTKPNSSSQKPASFDQTSSPKTSAAAAQPSSSSTCGAPGYDKGKPSAFYYVKTSSASTLEGCTAQCNTRGCVSFAVGNGECMLYSVPVAGNLNAATSSKYKFYDSACVLTASSSGSSVVKTSSSLSSGISGSSLPSLVSSPSGARTSSSSASSTAVASSVLPSSKPASSIVFPSSVVPSTSGSNVASSSAAPSNILPSSISYSIISSSASFSPASSSMQSAPASVRVSSSAPISSSDILSSSGQGSGQGSGSFSAVSSSKSDIVSASVSSSARSSSVTPFSVPNSALSLVSSSSVIVSVSSTASSRVVLPTVDPAVDRSSSENLSPASSVTLFYTEPLPGTYTVLIAATLISPDYHGILLENIDAIDVISCSHGQVMVTFTNASSRATAMAWGPGTALFTLNTACNPTDERGVFIVTGVDSSVDALSLVFSTIPSKLQDVVQELDISYGTLETGQDGKQLTSYTTTATSYFMHSRSSTLTSSTFVTTVTPSLTSMTYTSAFSTSSITASSSASVSQSIDGALSASGSSASTSSSWALSPSALAIMQELSAGLPAPDADGNIIVPIKNKAVPSETISPEPYNIDASYQAQLQAALAADQLDSAETLLTAATDALAEEADSNITDGMGVTLGTSNYSGMDDATYQEAINTPVSVTLTKRTNIPARAEHAPAPVHRYASRAVPVSSSTTLATGRNADLSKRDGWDTFFAVMGDDIVGEICEICGAISAGKDLYDAMKCLFGDCPSPPQQTITYLTGTTSQEFSMSATLNTNAYVYGDSKATVLCANCYIKVSSLKVEGKVQVVPKQIGVDGNFVLSAVFTATQSSVSSLLYSIRVTGANSGSFDRAISTFALDSLTAPNVFTISPKFLYGIGMTYETDGAVDIQAGAVMTLSNAAATIDVKEQTASNPQNWQPTAQVTYPNLVNPGRIVLTPYMKTSIQISLNIFGQYLENAVVLTTQTNMGFDAQVLTTSQNLKARSATYISTQSDTDVSKRLVSKRGLFSSILAGQAAAKAINAANQQTAANTCNAGSMKLNAIMHTKNQAVVGGVTNVLFDQDYKFGSKCIPFAAPAVTSSSTTALPLASPTSSSVAVSSSKPTTATSAAAPSCTTGFVPPSGSQCFKVVAHGDPFVEGKYLSKFGGGSPFLDGSPAGTFYLDSNGYMYESYYGAIMATDRTDGGAWMNFEMTPTTMPKAQCTKDSGSSKALVCYQTSTSVVSVCSSMGDSRRSIPMFGTPYSCFTPITFTYEDTTCPFSCGSAASSGISSPTVSSSPIASSAPIALPCRDPYGGWIPPSGSQCFRVVGHGLSTIEGKYLSSQGNGSPTFQWQGAAPGTYYLDGDGYMYDGTFGSVMATDRTDGGAWMSFTNQPGTMAKAVCTRDSTGAKSLVCYQTSTDVLSICGGFSADDSRQVVPIFGKPDETCQPITMTYEDIACPAFCSSSSSTVASPTSTISSAIAISSSAAPSCTSLSFVPPSGSTCFTIAGHGLSHIENQLLSVHDGWANPAFGYPGYTPAIFYIDASGYTYVASDILNGYIMASNLAAPSWLAFTMPSWIESHSDYIKATCSLNPHSNTMGCGQNGTYVLSVESTYSSTDSRSAIPAWSVWDSNFKQISLTYNTVKCPVACSSGSAVSSPVLSSYPSSTAASSAYKSTLLPVTRTTMGTSVSTPISVTPSSSPVCGARGNPNRHLYIYNDNVDSLQTCMDDCHTYPTCGSIQVAINAAGTFLCVAYANTTTEMLNPMNSSSYWWDSSCDVSQYSNFFSDLAASSSPSASASTSSVAAIPTPQVTSSSTSSTPAATETATSLCGGYYPGGILPVGNTSYNIYCGQSGAAPVTAISSTYAPNFKACMDSCTAIYNCQGVIFREVDLYCTTYSTLHGPVTYLGSEIYDVAWIQELRHS